MFSSAARAFPPKAASRISAAPNGLYAQKYPYPPEQMVSRSFFDAHPDAFFDFYCDRMIALEAQPNRAHRKLAELEQAGTLSA